MVITKQPPNQRGGLQIEAIRANGKKKVPVIAVDEEELRTHVSEVVRQSVEETLNGLLDAEADTLARQGVVSATQSAPVPAQGITSGICRPRLARFISKFPSYGTCLLKLR